MHKRYGPLPLQTMTTGLHHSLLQGSITSWSIKGVTQDEELMNRKILNFGER